ncbi:MAG: hypothetical protein IH849_09060 [Acidobacteria bacterium]|nr:hypothetical protein [Acidobacteriota bacterium]
MNGQWSFASGIRQSVCHDGADQIALREGLEQAMAADENVFLIGEDIGVYGGAFGIKGGLL